MNILDQLSSRRGDKTEESNRKVAEFCITAPEYLKTIIAALDDGDSSLASDCIEVCTLVSERDPSLTAPYTVSFFPLLESSVTKIRWEAAHALAYTALPAAQEIDRNMPLLRKTVENDKSTIVRDYVLDAVANFAQAGEQQASAAYPVLKSALDIWGEKHGKQVLKGMQNVLQHCPLLKTELAATAESLLTAKKGVIVKEAKKLLKVCGK